MLFLSRFIIHGHSMEPTLRNGSSVLGSSIPYLFSEPLEKDIVIIKRGGKILIKRIKKIRDGKFFLTGDNPRDSLDSKTLGWFGKKDIIGKIIYLPSL